MIRLATIDDLPKMLDCARAFFIEGKLDEAFSPESFIRNWTRMLAVGSGAILIAVDSNQVIGGLGGVICEETNTGDTISVELFWHVLPHKRGVGMRLLNEWERLSKERGAVRIAMGHLANLNNESMQKLYARRGYKLSEQFFIKTL